MLKITKCEQTINQNVKRKSVLRAFKEKDLVNNYFFIFFLHENYINTEENYVNADRGKYNDFAGFMENINLFKK